MWVILVTENTSIYRDNILDNILNNVDKPREEYLILQGSYKYSSSISIQNCKKYKNKSGAERLIKKFNSDTNKEYFTNKFSWIKDKHLSTRKLSEIEWNQIIDMDLQNLNYTYQLRRDKISNK